MNTAYQLIGNSSTVIIASDLVLVELVGLLVGLEVVEVGEMRHVVQVVQPVVPFDEQPVGVADRDGREAPFGAERAGASTTKNGLNLLVMLTNELLSAVSIDLFRQIRRVSLCLSLFEFLLFIRFHVHWDFFFLFLCHGLGLVRWLRLVI